MTPYIFMSKETTHKEAHKMPLSPSQKKYQSEYNKTRYDYVKIRVVKGYRDSVIHEAASRAGVSINEYVLSTIADRIKAECPDIENVDAWKVSSQREGE